MLLLLKTHLPVLAILLFLLITFGISVIEKLTDWKGTIGYIQNNFKNTIINKLITPLIVGLVGLEIVTCILLIFGFYHLLVNETKDNSLLGCVFSATCIMYMLIGQRIAKDYEGATSLAVYFIITVLGMYLLSL